jgi:hypothetical protein
MVELIKADVELQRTLVTDQWMVIDRALNEYKSAISSITYSDQNVNVRIKNDWIRITSTVVPRKKLVQIADAELKKAAPQTPTSQGTKQEILTLLRTYRSHIIALCREAIRKWYYVTFRRFPVSEVKQKQKTRRGGKNKRKSATQPLSSLAEDDPLDKEVAPVVKHLADLGISVDEAIEGDTRSVAESSLASALSCVVCFERPREKAAIPCGHRCLCRVCADNFSCPGAKCPVCRTEIMMMCEIFG